MVHPPSPGLPTWQTSRYVVVTLPVEIDMSNARDVQAQLLYLLDEGGADATPLIVDLTGTRFCDSTAINALLHTHTRARGLGRRLYAAVRSRSPVRRVFDITATPVLIPTCDDLGSAIALAVVDTVDEMTDDGGDGSYSCGRGGDT
jgi:anti-sigma B factor antagonist